MFMSIQKYKETFNKAWIEVIEWELASLNAIQRTSEVRDKVYFLLSLKKHKLWQVDNNKLH